MKHESRGAGEGVGGIGGRSEEGSERLGRAEIVGIKGKGEEKGDIIATGPLRHSLSGCHIAAVGSINGHATILRLRSEYIEVSNTTERQPVTYRRTDVSHDGGDIPLLNGDAGSRG